MKWIRTKRPDPDRGIRVNKETVELTYAEALAIKVEKAVKKWPAAR